MREFGPEMEKEIQRLLHALLATAPSARSLLVTGPVGAEGTTTIAGRLAAALVRNGLGRIVLVDANLSAPGLHAMFDAPLVPGILNWSGEGELVARPIEHLDGLFLIPAGREREPLASAAKRRIFESLAKRVREDFDFAVWDAPAALAQPDVSLLANLTDGVIVVVESDRTKACNLQLLKEQFDRAGANLLGAVMNRSGRYMPRILRSGDAE